MSRLTLFPASLGILLAAFPALADASEVVTLHNGAVYQGALVEKVPHDHVTLKLATGEVKRFAWEDVETSADADATHGQASTQTERTEGRDSRPSEQGAKTTTSTPPAYAISRPASIASQDSEPDASSASPPDDGGDATIVRAPQSRDHLDLQPAFLVPVGDLSNTAGMGLGALLGFEHTMTGTIGLTGRAGYVYGFSTETNDPTLHLSTSMSNVPILAGANIYFAGQREGFYVAPELGMVFTIVSVNASVYDATSMASASGSSSSTNTTLGGGLSAGYRDGHFDFALGSLALDVGHPGASTALFSTVGYGFDL